MEKINEIVDKNIDLFSEQYHINESLVLLALLAGKKISKEIRKKTDQCYKKCHTIKDSVDMKICYNNCSVKSNEEKIKELKKINCNEKEDPFKCKVKVNKEIEKLTNKLNKKKQTLNKLKIKKKGV